MFRYTFFLAFLVSAFLVGCGSNSGDRFVVSAKAKILSTGNIVLVKDSNIKNFAVGDAVIIKQNPTLGHWNLGVLDLVGDTIMVKTNEFPESNLIQYRRAVLIEIKNSDLAKKG